MNQHTEGSSSRLSKALLDIDYERRDDEQWHSTLDVGAASFSMSESNITALTIALDDVEQLAKQNIDFVRILDLSEKSIDVETLQAFREYTSIVLGDAYPSLGDNFCVSLERLSEDLSIQGLSINQETLFALRDIFLGLSSDNRYYIVHGVLPVLMACVGQNFEALGGLSGLGKRLIALDKTLTQNTADDADSSSWFQVNTCLVTLVGADIVNKIDRGEINNAIYDAANLSDSDLDKLQEIVELSPQNFSIIIDLLKHAGEALEIDQAFTFTRMCIEAAPLIDADALRDMSIFFVPSDIKELSAKSLNTDNDSVEVLGHKLRKERIAYATVAARRQNAQEQRVQQQ